MQHLYIQFIEEFRTLLLLRGKSSVKIGIHLIVGVNFESGNAKKVKCLHLNAWMITYIMMTDEKKNNAVRERSSVYSMEQPLTCNFYGQNNAPTKIS